MQKEESEKQNHVDKQQYKQKSNEISLKGLAERAGFNVSLDRAALILPQLEWILDESILIDSLNLTGIEPPTSIFEFLVKCKQEEDDALL
jgi:hypothetical protein